MNNSIKRYLTLLFLLTLIITVFTACKGKPGTDGSTEDPFSVTEYPATVTQQNVTPSSTETTTGMFDDFATTTTPATTTTKPSSGSQISIPDLTFPGVTNPTLPPTVDPQLTNTTNGGSQVDVAKLLSAVGYSYDPEEDCFYSELDSWQRKGGFAPHYDLGAFLLNMHYITFTVDFDWGGESWRLQFWKGNYSVVLDGAEIGVYTKPLGADTTLYDTADNDHLLNMSMELYTKNPRVDSTRYFRRPATDHWWLTGFKLVKSNAVPGKMVMVCTIRFRDSEMADSFTKSLEQVRGQYAPLKTFKAVKTLNNLADDSYYRETNTVTMCWRAVGWLNYDFPEAESTTKKP
ncbi:MAG: DUF4474 domain-containing protein [Ruminococcaceae bacterium]|jgi:hypothetical protein|nr:DUF4474 domain-containing protein [Oscillospiraceae bacterium]